MGRILVYLGRFLVILVGYAMAAVGASLFLNLLLLGAVDLGAGEMRPVLVGSMFVSVPVLALFAGYFAFIPAVPAILLGEILRKRDWLFYAIAGAAVAAVATGLSGLAADRRDHLSADSGLALAIVGSGLVGGIVYWLVAGRGAGNWRDRIESRAISPGPTIS